MSFRRYVASILLIFGTSSVLGGVCESYTNVSGFVNPYPSMNESDEALTWKDTSNPYLARFDGSFKVHLGDDMNAYIGDMEADTGVFAKAMANGCITYTGYPDGKIAGYVVITEHQMPSGQQFCVQYDHLQLPADNPCPSCEDEATEENFSRGDLDTTIKQGNAVVAGQNIGRISTTGAPGIPYDPHLHVEVRLDYPKCRGIDGAGDMVYDNISKGYTGVSYSSASWNGLQEELLNDRTDPSSLFGAENQWSQAVRLQGGQWNVFPLQFYDDVPLSNIHVYCYCIIGDKYN